jgi:antitoxin VapB
MRQRAKLFRSGGSQAVRLPKEFRFEGYEEVLVSRQGDRVIAVADLLRAAGVKDAVED